MITISLCMIVKNEERLLRRCLDSIADLVDEIIIADTGSTDATKEIAGQYTDKVFDFEWTGSFADARNYASSKATMEYIYTADADEYLDDKAREKFRQLKSVLIPEVEIVQMLYCTPPETGSFLNFDREYRPKLYRRLREFVWIDPIHETLRLDPVVFDSDIEIIHAPEHMTAHTRRDLRAFKDMSDRGIRLSKKLHHMYAMEVFKSGDKADFADAESIFLLTLEQGDRDMDEIKEAMCVLCRGYRLNQNVPKFFSYALKDAVTTSCAEVCCELGYYYKDLGDYQEAFMWFQNALTETESIIDVRCSKEIPQKQMELIKSMC